jgi:hypothetical protein
MPLQEIADEIIRLSQHRGSTPVLVTPSYLSLRRRFFLELIETLAGKSAQSIRIDWYRPMPGLFTFIGDRIASARAARINRSLEAVMAGRESTASIQITASIARPGGRHRKLVIGLCDHRLQLPTWTTKIRLGGSPDEWSDIQTAASLTA